LDVAYWCTLLLLSLDLCTHLCWTCLHSAIVKECHRYADCLHSAFQLPASTYQHHGYPACQYSWTLFFFSHNLHVVGACVPQAGVPPVRSYRVPSVPDHCLAAHRSTSHTTNLHPYSTHALADAQHNRPVHWGLPPLGYPWNLQSGSLGSVHAPSLATPAQNSFSISGGDDKRGQSVAPPVINDAEICDSLLPGLPLHPRVQWCSASHLWCRLLRLLGRQCWVSSTHQLVFQLPLLRLHQRLVNL